MIYVAEGLLLSLVSSLVIALIIVAFGGAFLVLFVVAINVTAAGAYTDEYCFNIDILQGTIVTFGFVMGFFLFIDVVAAAGVLPEYILIYFLFLIYEYHFIM